MNEKPSGITFHLLGADRSDDLVRAGDFVVFLQRLLAVLSAIDDSLNGHPTRFFRVAGLQIGSASATLVEQIEEKFIARRHVMLDVEPAFKDLLAKVEREERPEWTTSDVLIKLRELAAPLSHVTSASVGILKHQPTKLDDDYRLRIDRVIGRDVTTIGELIGTLDAVNVHDHFRAYLYQRRGESRIACDFPASLRRDVVAALGQHVRIRGELSRRESSERPYRVKIKHVEIVPSDETLPLFAQLYGLSESFPNEDPVEYVRRLREADA